MKMYSLKWPSPDKSFTMHLNNMTEVEADGLYKSNNILWCNVQDCNIIIN